MTERLDPARTALLLFDVLNGHLKTPGGPVREPLRAAVANMARLLAASRASGVMVAYAAANHRADGRTSALLLTDTDNRLRPRGPEGPDVRPVFAGSTWEAQVIDELAPRPEDYLVPKYRWSAFFGTYLDLALRTRDVDTMVLVGARRTSASRARRTPLETSTTTSSSRATRARLTRRTTTSSSCGASSRAWRACAAPTPSSRCWGDRPRRFSGSPRARAGTPPRRPPRGSPARSVEALGAARRRAA